MRRSVRPTWPSTRRTGPACARRLAASAAFVLLLISDKIAHARNSKALMRRSLGHHAQVLEAIRSGDGPAAAQASAQSLYDYYAGYVPAADRAALRAMLDT